MRSYNMYELIETIPNGFCIKFNEYYIPLDIRNKDFKEYVEKVDSGEIEDVLPEGMLDQLRNENG